MGGGRGRGGGPGHCPREEAGEQLRVPFKELCDDDSKQAVRLLPVELQAGACLRHPICSLQIFTEQEI